MAAIDFNEGLVQVVALIPEDKTEFPVKKVFDTLMRHNIENYFDHHESVTDIDVMWASIGVDTEEKWVGVIEDTITSGFLDAMEDADKGSDYRYQMRYKDCVLTIPYLDMEPRATPGYKLVGRIRSGCLFDLTKKHLRFDKHIDDSGVLDIAKDMFLYSVKSTLLGFPTPVESPLENYYEKHQLVEIAYSINDDDAEAYEDDSISDLMAFVFESYFSDIDDVINLLFKDIGLTPSSVIEIYNKNGLLYIYLNNETIEEIVFKQVYDASTCDIREGGVDDPQWLCRCYV